MSAAPAAPATSSGSQAMQAMNAMMAAAAQAAAQPAPQVAVPQVVLNVSPGVGAVPAVQPAPAPQPPQPACPPCEVAGGAVPGMVGTGTAAKKPGWSKLKKVVVSVILLAAVGVVLYFAWDYVYNNILKKGRNGKNVPAAAKPEPSDDKGTDFFKDSDDDDMDDMKGGGSGGSASSVTGTAGTVRTSAEPGTIAHGSPDAESSVQQAIKTLTPAEAQTFNDMLTAVMKALNASPKTRNASHASKMATAQGEALKAVLEMRNRYTSTSAGEMGSFDEQQPPSQAVDVELDEDDQEEERPDEHPEDTDPAAALDEPPIPIDIPEEVVETHVVNTRGGQEVRDGVHLFQNTDQQDAYSLADVLPPDQLAQLDDDLPP